MKLAKTSLLALAFLFLPLAKVSAQQGGLRCRTAANGHHYCTINGESVPIVIAYIRNGERDDVLDQIKDDIDDSMSRDEREDDNPQELFADIKLDFQEDQKHPSRFGYPIGYYDIDDALRPGTTFDTIIWEAVKEAFAFDTVAHSAKAKDAAARVVRKLGEKLPQPKRPQY